MQALDNDNFLQGTKQVAQTALAWLLLANVAATIRGKTTVASAYTYPVSLRMQMIEPHFSP